MSLVVYLNGRTCPLESATVPLTDRGLLFGDGIYEVWRTYAGRPFRMREHVERLHRSAREIRLELPDVDWQGVQDELMRANGLADRDATFYVQVTRGAPTVRGHAFPSPPVDATVFAIARPLDPAAVAALRGGVAAIVHADLRWGRCDIKSVNLLANVLASQAAVEAGAWEAILVRGDVVTEGTKTNLFAVVDGELRTHPEGPHILGGITRSAVLEIARALSIPVVERALGRAELDRASEVILVGTTTEVTAVTRVDDRPVGDRAPGPVSRRLSAGFCDLVARG